MKSKNYILVEVEKDVACILKDLRTTFSSKYKISLKAEYECVFNSTSEFNVNYRQSCYICCEISFMRSSMKTKQRKDWPIPTISQGPYRINRC